MKFNSYNQYDFVIWFFNCPKCLFLYSSLYKYVAFNTTNAHRWNDSWTCINGHVWEKGNRRWWGSRSSSVDPLSRLTNSCSQRATKWRKSQIYTSQGNKASSPPSSCEFCPFLLSCMSIWREKIWAKTTQTQYFTQEAQRVEAGGNRSYLLLILWLAFFYLLQLQSKEICFFEISGKVKKSPERPP